MIDKIKGKAGKRSKDYKELEELLIPTDEVIELNSEIEESLTSGYSPITYKERIFVQEYCKHGILKKAAISAGYGEAGAHTMANRLLHKPNVQLAILKRQQALSNIAIINREWVMLELAEIVEELKSKPVIDTTTQLRALDMICKLSGFYNETTINLQNNYSQIEIKIVKKDEPEQLD
jgi:hypothetical protein